MRILHVPYSFFPDPAGGTEIYVDALARCQRASGFDAAVAAPGPRAATYDHDQLKVWRFPVSATLPLPELYGQGDSVAARAFGTVLDEFQPDVVHLHAFTSAISARLAREAKQRGCPIVFNYHTPTVSCPRQTLRLFGAEICDGKIDQRRCTACNLHSHGVPRGLATMIGAMPAAASRELARMNLQGGIWTVLRMPELIDIRIHAFRSLMDISDRVIALCHWTRDLLLLNGIPAGKLTLCRQGINWSSAAFPPPGSRPAATLPLRMIFLGRMHETKGPHVLIEALRQAPDLPVRIDFFGVRQGEGGDTYAERLRQMSGADSRIRLLPALSPSEVIATLQRYDAILIPSQWLETGPLVVLEAFAARTPVIASALGGIAELVTDGADGLLVSPWHSPAAWAAALRRICDHPGLLDEFSAGILPPRHSQDAARELVPVYESLLGAACATSGKIVSAGIVSGKDAPQCS
jgi:glycosyltransferase involved in cell wall biosynthesis